MSEAKPTRSWPPYMGFGDVRFEIATRLPPKAAAARLAAITAPRLAFLTFRPFLGAVGAERFSLVRQSFVRGEPTPQIEGVIDETADGARVRGVIGLSPLTQVGVILLPVFAAMVAPTLFFILRDVLEGAQGFTPGGVLFVVVFVLLVAFPYLRLKPAKRAAFTRIRRALEAETVVTDPDLDA